MPVFVGELGEIKVNCLVWSGRVSRAEALGVAARIDARRPEFGSRWISYFDSEVDLSDLDPDCLMALRERLRPVTAALAAKGAFEMMLVSNSRYNDPLLAMWRSLTATDDAYASSPVLVHDIASAARALGLAAADAERTREWIEARVSREA